MNNQQTSCVDCDEIHAPYALCAIKRKKELKDDFREKSDPRDDEVSPRSAYHRDRDRIIWSKAFKRLQNKTQVFPHYFEDHYKRRLTHSLEVSAIATALARCLNLNEVVTDAIALGHDLGHTPFGHAGEEALNNLSSEYFKNKSLDGEYIPLKGFNHCFQAIEVVSRIEKHKSEMGLNLTRDVRDGILKHICDRNNEESRQTKPYFCLENICKCSSYKQYGEAKYGSLEAQCVWFADKLCYLFGDIEDGLRADIFNYKDMFKHPFAEYMQKAYLEYLGSLPIQVKRAKKKEYLQIYKLKKEDMDIIDKYYYIRNKSITLSINHCKKEFERRLKDNSITNTEDVLNCDKRLVNVDEEWQIRWGAFYKKYMVGMLFENNQVKDSNYKAREIINKLFNRYLKETDLIPLNFRKNAERVYKDIVEDRFMDFIITRNYIAGMTDLFAIQKYKDLFCPWK